MARVQRNLVRALGPGLSLTLNIKVSRRGENHPFGHNTPHWNEALKLIKSV